MGTKREDDEEALKASEVKYRRLFEAAKDGILILDAATGQILDINPYLVDLLGYPLEAYLGKHLWEIGAFSDKGASKIAFAELQTKKYVHYEDLPLETIDGRLVEVEFVSNVYMADGQEVIQCNIRNITERRQAEKALHRSEELFSTIFQSVPVAIDISTIPEGRILKVNQYFLDTMGYKADEVLNYLVSDLGLWSPFGQRDEFIRELKLNGSVRGKEGRWKTKTGEIRDMLISIESLEIDGKACLLAIGNDITERKQAERARLEVYKERELLELKERFISRMSHEFRTPLAVILSSKETLEHYFDRLTPERRQEKLHQIEEHVRYITALLDDVLLLSKGQAGKMEFQPVPMNLMIVCQTMFEQIQLIDKTEHKFTFTASGVLEGIKVDERLLQHILINLLSNAIKYSPEGGEVRLALSRDGDAAVIQISDEGIGIPEEDQVHLFEPFRRASNVKSIKGTGLGLAIAKESADAHGGAIICESEVGKGTTFTVRLPTGV